MLGKIVGSECVRRNNPKTVFRVRTLITRHRVFATLACFPCLEDLVDAFGLLEHEGETSSLLVEEREVDWPSIRMSATLGGLPTKKLS